MLFFCTCLWVYVKGFVTWTWKVGSRSAEGTFDIIVKDDDGKSVKVEWTIIVE